ncbi:MAG: ATP synthase F1 subunit epsilon [Candidatus Saccharibacteria bacterium]|nr:ATP synthase F1 subunit epsilon [Candidatus Saccharibacteria bacterium]
MQLKLVTLSGLKFDEEVYSVSIPTVDGEISVFPSHEPLVTVAAPGVITVRRTKDTKDEEFLMISGGVVEIDQTGVRILVDEADHGDEIVEAEAQAALERARQAHDEAGTQIEREKAKQLMDRHMVRLKVADLQRRKRRG